MPLLRIEREDLRGAILACRLQPDLAAPQSVDVLEGLAGIDQIERPARPLMPEIQLTPPFEVAVLGNDDRNSVSGQISEQAIPNRLPALLRDDDLVRLGAIDVEVKRLDH